MCKHFSGLLSGQSVGAVQRPDGALDVLFGQQHRDRVRQRRRLVRLSSSEAQQGKGANMRKF